MAKIEEIYEKNYLSLRILLIVLITFVVWAVFVFAFTQNTSNFIVTQPIPVQRTDDSGYVEIQTTLSHLKKEKIKLKVEYSDDGGNNFYHAAIAGATPNVGTIDVDNAKAYQIGSSDPIDTDDGEVSLTILWDTKSPANENGGFSDKEADIILRLTPNNDTSIQETFTSSLPSDGTGPSPEGISLRTGEENPGSEEESASVEEESPIEDGETSETSSNDEIISKEEETEVPEEEAPPLSSASDEAESLFQSGGESSESEKVIEPAPSIEPSTEESSVEGDNSVTSALFTIAMEEGEGTINPVSETVETTSEEERQTEEIPTEEAVEETPTFSEEVGKSTEETLDEKEIDVEETVEPESAVELEETPTEGEVIPETLEETPTEEKVISDVGAEVVENQESPKEGLFDAVLSNGLEISDLQQIINDALKAVEIEEVPPVVVVDDSPEIFDGDPVLTEIFHIDNVKPEIMYWTLNIESGTLSVNFSEAMNGLSTPDLTRVELINFSGASSYILNGFNHTWFNKQILIITIQPDDLALLQSDMDSVISPANSDLKVKLGGALTDIAGNPLNDIEKKEEMIEEKVVEEEVVEEVPEEEVVEEDEGVIEEEDDDLVVIDPNALHKCTVAPPFQRISIGETATFIVNIQSDIPNSEFEIFAGDLPEGIYIVFETVDGTGSRQIEFMVGDTEESQKGSYDIPIFYQETTLNEETSTTVCQFSIIAE